MIKTSITSGVKQGFAAIFSILMSDVLLVLLAWCGLAAVISSTPALFNAIKYAGAAYLFYLGVQTIRAIFKPTVETSEEKKSSADAKGIIGRGMLVTLLNPKTLLFYISFFAQFINVQAEHSPDGVYHSCCGNVRDYSCLFRFPCFLRLLSAKPFERQP